MNNVVNKKPTLVVRLCSWIVRRAMLDPRCQEFVFDEVCDFERFDDACREAVLEHPQFEHEVERMIEESVSEHERDVDHVSNSDIVEVVENAIRDTDPTDMRSFDDEVERVVNEMNVDDISDDRILKAVKDAVDNGRLNVRSVLS